MALSHTSSNPAADSQVWESLKRAIAESSGFKSWQLECKDLRSAQSHSLDTLDTLVHQYLRDTLETLAY